MKQWSVAGLVCLLWAAVGLAADAPYFGKWKVNSTKSQFNQIVGIEKLPSGDYRFEQDGFAYTFKPDGKEYPMPDGGTGSWKIINDNTWEVTTRANGKIGARIKLTLSGDTLTSDVTIPQAGGKDLTESGTATRVSGGPGILGKWQSKKANADAIWMELTPDGPDGLKIAAPNSLCVAKFDGKPYPMSGSTDGAKQTMSFRKMGPTSFEAITYIDGKAFFKDVYAASADGKTLTDAGTPVATNKASKVVFDRQ